MNEKLEKIKYESPEFEYVEFESESILTVSGSVDNDSIWKDLWD